MNIHPKDLKAVVQAYVDGVLQGAPKEKFAELQPQNHAAALQRVQEKMLEVESLPGLHRGSRTYLWARSQ